MSEQLYIKGKCGKELTGKRWKQGGSIKCPVIQDSTVTYPRPAIMWFHNKVYELCIDCKEPSLNNQEVRTK